MNNVYRFTHQATQQPKLNLSGPRIWTAEDLAAFLRVSLSWVHRRTKKSSADPPPRCPGIAGLRFDTGSPKFQAWLARQIGAEFDRVEGDNV